MSVRHPEFCDLVEGLGRSLSTAERSLLEGYAEADTAIEDQLDRGTRERVEEVTGSTDVWSPQRAASALLVAYPE